MQRINDIRDRLLSQFATTQTEQLPAVLQKIATGLATELHHLQVEQTQTEQRIIAGLRKKVKGQQIQRHLPAASILQVLPDNQRKKQYTSEEHFERLNDAGQTMFLTPLYAIHLHPVRIAYRYWNGQLWRQTGVDQIQKVAIPDNLPNCRANELLLGIHIAEGYDLPTQIPLYINAKTEIGQAPIDKIRPLLHAETDENQFPLMVKPLGTKLPSEDISDWRERHWLLKKVERPVAERYKNCFVEIQHFEQLPQTTVVAVLQQVVQMLQGEEVHWLKLIFPTALQAEDIAALQLGFNCFPVINRRLCSREEAPSLPLTTFPLKCSDSISDRLALPEYFLGLQKVFYGSGHHFKPAVTQRFTDAPRGTYGIQHGGVLAFHAAEAKRQLAYTLTLLETEKAVIQNVFGQRLQQGALQSDFRKVREGLDSLHHQLAFERLEETDWFLHCKPLNERENVLVRFWVGQRENLVKNNSKIKY